MSFNFHSSFNIPDENFQDMNKNIDDFKNSELIDIFKPGFENKVDPCLEWDLKSEMSESLFNQSSSQNLVGKYTYSLLYFFFRLQHR